MSYYEYNRRQKPNPVVDPNQGRPPPRGDDPMGEHEPTPAVASAAPMLSKTSGQGRMGGSQNETGVDKMSSFMKPFRDTVQVVLPYQSLATSPVGFLNKNQEATANTIAFTFRLNSIYDVQTSDQSFAANPTTPVADLADATIQTPMYRAYWASLYDYWTVVSSHYKFRIWVHNTHGATNGQPSGCSIWEYKHGRQAPPLYAQSSGTVRVPDFYRRQHSNSRHKMLRHMLPTAIQDNMANMVEFSGTWTPGSIQHEVVEDELAQVWNRETEVPPTEEMVTFILQKPDLISGFGTGDQYVWSFEIYYTVQWKDLSFEHQYVTQSSGVTAVNFYAVSNNNSEGGKSVT